MVSEPCTMATSKERIKSLKARVGSLQECVHQMELGIADKLHQLELTINRLFEDLFSPRVGTIHHHNDRDGRSRTIGAKNRDDMDGGEQIFS